MTQTKPYKSIIRRCFSLRNILFLIVFCSVLWLFVSGCAVASVISDLGTTRTEYCDYRYEMSPDTDEIVFTSKRTKQYNYLPFYGFLHHKPAWASVKNVEERIPLDPPPEVLSRRCTLIVEPDPDALPANFLEPVSTPDSLTSDRRLIVAPEPVDFISWTGNSMSSYGDGIHEFAVTADKFPLSNDDTLRLRVRPAELHDLVQPFRIRLSQNKEANEEMADSPSAGFTGSPGFIVQPDGTTLPLESLSGGWADSLIAGRIRGKPDPDGREYLMFPMSVDGGSLESLAASGSSSEITLRVRVSENLYPFRDRQTLEIMNEYRDSGDTPTVEAVCWKVFWFPAALAFDVLALPVYLIVIPVDYFIWENRNGFR